MPLAAFLESSKKREAAGQAMSSYALTFPKGAIHALGARHVIYGLSAANNPSVSVTTTGLRTLPQALLPLQEQYRYVSYNPTGTYAVDWTHEREWRWPFVGDLTSINEEFAEYGLVSNADDIPGLDFAISQAHGIGIIVKTDEDARRLKYDVLSLIDRHVVARYHFAYMLVLDRLPSTPQLYAPDAVAASIRAAMLDFDEYFDLESSEVKRVAEDFSARVAGLERAHHTAHPAIGEPGGCWLWIHDNTHPYARALVQSGRIQVNKEGRYLASLDELNQARGLSQRERIAEELSAQLLQDVGLPCGRFSVLLSHNPDGVPFYIDREPSDDLFHNTD
jgi:hypothetical protein